MATTLITDYLGRGLAADRPANVAIAANGLAFYEATDTHTLSMWDGAAWTVLGATGPVGPAGPAGATGAIGLEGPAGATGAASTVAGPAGSTGPQGIQGVPGDTGAAGTSGASSFADLTGAATYAQLPAELASVPLAFSLPGKPAAGAVLNLVLPFAVTVAAALAGAVTYAGTLTTADAVFTLNRVSGAVVTALGTVTINPTSHVSATLAGAGGAMAAGDVLQLVAPGTQDATLADVGLTLLAGRV